MELTISSILALATLLIGYVSKAFNIVDKKYIPIQNIVIGITAGIITFLTGLSDNIFQSITMCLISSLSAGGIYDALLIKKKGG